VYELTHEFENRVKRPNDRMRWALSEMLPNTWRDFLQRFYGASQILEILVTSGWLGATEDDRNHTSISNSMNKIMHGDLLAARMCDRRWKK
jgi:molybdopterin-biosynthesis enzyme MoeA-like protein